MSDRNEQRAIGRLLVSLLEKPGSVYLSMTVSEGEVAVYATLQGERQITVTRPDLLRVLQALTGTEPLRTCGRCGDSKPECLFSIEARYCKDCERQRVKEYEQRKG